MKQIKNNMNTCFQKKQNPRAHRDHVHRDFLSVFARAPCARTSDRLSALHSFWFECQSCLCFQPTLRLLLLVSSLWSSVEGCWVIGMWVVGCLNDWLLGWCAFWLGLLGLVVLKMISSFLDQQCRETQPCLGSGTRSTSPWLSRTQAEWVQMRR